MRIPTLMCATVALIPSPAYAQNDQVQRGPAPDWVTPSPLMDVPEDAGGLLFVRQQDTFVRLDNEGQEQYSGYRIRILHPNALQLGNISITWNPASGAPTVHAIKVHRDGEVIDVLESASFEILRRENQLELAALNGDLTAVLRIADLRVGDELEVSTTTRVDDPTLGSDDAGILLLLPDPAPGRFHLGLSWIDGQEPKIKMTPDMETAAQHTSYSVDFRFDNPPLMMPPKDAPARFSLVRFVEFSDFPDWKSISRRFAPIYSEAAQIPVGSSLTREVERIKNANESLMARASAALKLVQQDVRYVYVGLDGGNYRPVSAEETWQLRYGDCKGKTVLLLALLQQLGVEAEAILVNSAGNDDGLDERLPNPAIFDHVLVRARIDGETYYLDGTLPAVASPSTDPVFPFNWVLPLSEHGGTIEKIEWQPPETPEEINLYEIDASTGFDEPAEITSTSILRGIKGLEQQLQMSALTPSQLLNGFRQNAVGDTWQTIEDVKWHYDQDARASILTIRGTGAVDWEDSGGGIRAMSLPGGGFRPPERRARSADQDQDLPYSNKPEFSCFVTTVRLPDDTQPEQWSYNSSFNQRMFGQNYFRAFDIRDGAIRMVRGFRVEDREIDAAWAAEDNDEIASFDNSMARIYFDPDDDLPHPADRTRVPATYEIDWTAKIVPCLSYTMDRVERD